MRGKISKEVIKSSYFANWADIFGFPIAYSLLPLVLPFKFITPNIVTIIAFSLYTLGCVFLFLDFPYHNFLAAFLVFAGFIGDDLDGILARTRNLSSTIGDYLDKVLDILKIFLITLSVSIAVYFQTFNILYVFLGFTACFLFMYRYYIKLETMFSKINSDPKYLERSAQKREELTQSLDKITGIKSYWIKNRTIFFVDEAEFVIITAIGAIFDKLEYSLWVLAISQILITIFRLFERGYQLNTNSENLLKPLRK